MQIAVCHENVLPARGEGVDRRVADQHHLDRARVEPGSGDQRPRDVAEERLGLGVAKDGRRRLLRTDRAGENGGDGEQDAEGAEHGGHLARLD